MRICSQKGLLQKNQKDLVDISKQDFIEKNKCTLSEVHFLTDINKLYHAAIKDIGGEYFAEIIPSAQKLQNKLITTFGERIYIFNSTVKKGNII